MSTVQISEIPLLFYFRAHNSEIAVFNCVIDATWGKCSAICSKLPTKKLSLWACLVCHGKTTMWRDGDKRRQRCDTTQRKLGCSRFQLPSENKENKEKEDSNGKANTEEKEWSYHRHFPFKYLKIWVAISVWCLTVHASLVSHHVLCFRRNLQSAGMTHRAPIISHMLFFTTLHHILPFILLSVPNKSFFIMYSLSDTQQEVKPHTTESSLTACLFSSLL